LDQHRHRGNEPSTLNVILNWQSGLAPP